MARKIRDPISDSSARIPEWHPFAKVEIGARIDYDLLPVGALFTVNYGADRDPSILSELRAKFEDNRVPTREKPLYFKVSRAKYREFAHPELMIREGRVATLPSVIEARADGHYEVYYVRPCVIASVRTPNLPPKAIGMIEKSLSGYGQSTDALDLVGRYALTREQMQWLSDNGLGFGELFHGDYGDDVAAAVSEIFADWNSKLEYKLFG